MQYFTVRAGLALTVAGLALALVSGCSGALKNARNAYYQGSPQAALEILNQEGPPALAELLFLMEKGVVEFDLADYAASTATLRRASDLMRAQETASVSGQAASLATTDLVLPYKGEYFERAWVHTYLVMDYLMQDQPESALVEAKQALKQVEAHPGALASDAATRALAGLCFEALGEDNDALIEYLAAAKALSANPAPVAPWIVHLARKMGFDREEKAFLAQADPALVQALDRPGNGSLVVFVAQGRGPVKEPHTLAVPPYLRIAWSRYEPGSGFAETIRLAGRDGVTLASSAVTTGMLTVAADSLKAREKQVVAKETARAAAKEAMAQAVENNLGSTAAMLTRIALFFSGEPDTRHWHTLPASLSVVRASLPAGEHAVRVTVGNSGSVSLPLVTVSAGGFAFAAVRLP